MRVFNAIFSVPPEYIFIKVVHIQNGKLFLKNLLHNIKKISDTSESISAFQSLCVPGAGCSSHFSVAALCSRLKWCILHKNLSSFRFILRKQHVSIRAEQRRPKRIRRLFVCAPRWFVWALLFSGAQQPRWQAWKWSRTFANGSEVLRASPLIADVPGWLAPD